MRSGRLIALAALLTVGVALVLAAERWGPGAHRRHAPTSHPSTARPTLTPLQVAAARRRAARASARRYAARQQRQVRQLVKLGYPIYCGGPKGRAIALTFDDGPGPYTPIALRLLRRNRARATFFIAGKDLVWFPSMPRKEARLAALGDHTWTHRPLTALLPATVTSELARTKRAVARLSGAQVTLFRPPYGARSAAASAAARKLGLLEVLWSVDTGDSEGAVPKEIFRRAIGARPGAIVLMHENRGQTLKALKVLLPRLRRRGFRTVTVPELLLADPPSTAQLRRGPAGCGRPRQG